MQLALKLHPDKNGHPMAADAFKKVASSYATLSDEDKRRTYDQVGHSENFEQEYEQRQHHGHHGGYQDVDPFDIFEAFFHGPGYMNQRRRQQRPQRQQHANHGQQQQQGARGLMQLLPIIVLIGISLIGSLSNIGSGPTYSLTKSATYDIRLVTSDYQIEYWVDADTHSQMRRSYNTQA